MQAGIKRRLLNISAHFRAGWAELSALIFYLPRVRTENRFPLFLDAL